MSDFEQPPGDPAAVKAAAKLIGSLGSDVKGEEQKLSTAFAAALAEWKGNRADTFRDASAGIQAQAKMAQNSLTNAAALLEKYANALDHAQADVAGLAHRSSQRHADAEREVESLDPNNPEIDRIWQHDAQVTSALVRQADTTRSELRRIARQTAGALDALTDTALPGGSKLSPREVGRRVDTAYGVTGLQADFDANALTITEAWRGLRTPGEALPEDAIEKDGEVDWAEVVRDSNDKLVNAWAMGTAPRAGWVLGQLSRNFVEYTRALKKVPKSYADLSGPGLDVPEGPVKDIDSVLDDVINTVHLTAADEKAFAADFGLIKAAETAGKGGLTGVLAGAGHVMSALGVVGDVWTIADPGVQDPTEADVLRGTAALNVAGIGAMEFGGAAATALGLDAAVGWVPVAGQIVVLGTGLVLAGDWAYHHWDEIKQWGADIGHFTTSTVPHFFEGVGADVGGFFEDVGSDVSGFVTGTVPHVFEDVGSDVGGFVTSTVPDALGDAAGATGHAFSSAASTVAGWLGL